MLPLPTTSAPDTEDHNVALHRVPPMLLKNALALQKAFKHVRDDGLKVRPAMAQLAPRFKISAERLRHKFDAWKKLGLAALIDHRKCRGSCGPGCKAARPVETIPQETIDHWKSGVDGKGGYLRNDKRGKHQAWETNIIGALQEGKVVPGLGTWKQLFAQIEPFKPIPARCPWHAHHVPPGLSFSSFLRHKSVKGVELLARKGQFAMWSELPQVRVDLTTLGVLEYVVFDDHRVDFYCFAEDGRGGVQAVEMWGVFAMDVSSRRVIAFGLRPRLNRDDGSAMGITREDVKFLMANILSTYGLPKDYDTTFIVENAAAAVSEEDEDLLAHVTRGKVKIKRSGLHNTDALVTGFREQWGNFRGKSWLESWFNPFDICLGTVKGQMGSNYTAKPGITDSQRRIADRMCALMSGMSDEQRHRLALPFEWAGEVHSIVQAAVDAVDGRTDHECTGFEPVRFFRWDATDANPKPLDYALAKLHGTTKELETFQALPLNVQNLLLSHGFTRVESPREKFERLYNKDRFKRLAEESFLHLMLNQSRKADKDGAPIVYRGGDTLDVLVKQGTRKFRATFTGKDHELSLGQEVRVTYMADNLEAGIFIVDETGRPLGRMSYSKDPRHDDLEGLQRRLGAQRAAYSEHEAEARRIMRTAPVLREEIAQVETNLAVVRTLKDGLAATTAPALEESSGLVREILTATPRPRTKTGISSAKGMVYVHAAAEEEEES